MHFSTIFTSSALVASALAADISVRVGGPNGELTFTPKVINASEGDTVTFKFWPKSHSVAQAAFANPCEPLENGFWSGYFPTDSGAHENTFVYTVNNASRPVWFYCTRGQHCQGGMVGVINPPPSGPNTIAAFETAARDADDNVEPTSTAGTGGEIKANSNSSSPSGTPSSSGSPSSTASDAASTSSGAAVALGVGKGLAFTGVFALFGFLI